MQLSWNPPVVAPQCCELYSVQLSTDESLLSFSLTINVPIVEEPVTATVGCLDYLGDNTTSQVMTIDSSKKQQVIININDTVMTCIGTAFGVTIEVLNSSCDANTYYNISWVRYSAHACKLYTSPLSIDNE